MIPSTRGRKLVERKIEKESSEIFFRFSTFLHIRSVEGRKPTYRRRQPFISYIRRMIIWKTKKKE